jgi:hypothetical protein
MLTGSQAQGLGGAGIRASFGSDRSLVVGLTSAVAQGTGVNAGTSPYNAAVYGIDVSGKLRVFSTDRLLIESGIEVSPVGPDTSLSSALSASNNESYRAMVGYNFGAVTIKGGYQAVNPYFSSPLSIDNLSAWQDPSNVAGPEIEAKYSPTRLITLAAHGNFLQGQNDIGAVSPIGRNDHVSHVNVLAQYGLPGSSSLDLGYEWVEYDLKNDQGLLAAPGKPTEQYITIGVGHNFGSSTALKMLYRVSNYVDDGTHLSPTGQDQHDDEAVTQLSIKF